MNKYIVIVILILLAIGGWYFMNSNQGKVGVIELKINQNGDALGVRLTPLEIVEDSRCPSDVQCIQAGTVRVRATLESGLGTALQIFKLNEPVTTEAESITLIEVNPGKVSTVQVLPRDYKFVFEVKKR